jgi:hypothetical protein
MNIKAKIIIASSLLVVFCLIYAIYSERNPKEIVTLFPDEGETKVKPLDAGGVVMPNAENLIYENLKTVKASTKSINLLPEPEQPLNIPRKVDEDSFDPIGSILFGLTNDQSKNKPVIISEFKEEDQEPSVDLISSIIDSSKPLSTQHDTKEEKGLNIVEVDKIPSKILPNKPISKARKKHYKIQLASVKTEAEGQKTWDRLKQRHSKILGKSEMHLKRIKHSNGVIFYSVQAGNYDSLNAAKSVCRKLSSLGQNCIPID